MELDRIMQLLKAKTEVKLLRFVSERGPHCCSACLAHDGKVFQADDPDLPELPIHPNCRCKLVEQDSREQVNRPTEVNLLAENQSNGKQVLRNIPEATQTALEMKYMPTGTSEMIGGGKGCFHSCNRLRHVGNKSKKCSSKLKKIKSRKTNGSLQ